MNKIAMALLLLLGLTGCDGFFSDVDPKALTPKQQRQLNAATDQTVNGYRNVELTAVCIRGVLYYQTSAPHGTLHYVPAISSKTLLPERCNEVKL